MKRAILLSFTLIFLFLNVGSVILYPERFISMNEVDISLVDSSLTQVHQGVYEFAATIKNFFSINYVPAPPKPNFFEVILFIGIMIGVLAADVLFLYVVFKKTVTPHKIQAKKTVLDIKISSVLILVLGTPVFLSDIYLLVAGGLAVMSLGYLGLVIYILGVLFTSIGAINLFIGIGLFKLNFTAWKGSIFMIFVLIIINLIPMTRIIFYTWMMFPLTLGESAAPYLIILPILYIFCYLGVLICILIRKNKFSVNQIS